MKDTNDTQVEEPIAVPFEREDRYIVLKIKDLEMLNPVLLEELTGTLSAIANLTTMPRREYVVVESDWPEYETVWKMLEERVNWERAFKLGSKHPTNDTQGPEVVAWLRVRSIVGDRTGVFLHEEVELRSEKLLPLITLQSHQEAVAKKDAALLACVVGGELLGYAHTEQLKDFSADPARHTLSLIVSREKYGFCQRPIYTRPALPAEPLDSKPTERECRLWEALDSAGYALFQIKRMQPQHVPMFASAKHKQVCEILDLYGTGIAKEQS